ncbi:MAG: hypothetical protein AMXMBFR25_30120 [Lysobacterales bacterium]
MSSADPDARTRRALELFRELLDLDAKARADCIERECGNDADLRAAVLRLLALDAEPAPIDQGAPPPARAPDAPDPRIGGRVGPFRLDAVLGEGGMGTVFRASRIAGGFEQQVALKLIRGGVDGALARRRFERERAILARLAHPDIVPLIDGGVGDEGVPWYAMPLIDGEPATRHCDARRLSLRERVALIARVCEAVQAAHQALIVHRDLKPSNLLVDAQGRPHLLDFGIAKLLDRGDDLTLTAAHLMTPAYAAPEQIRGAPVTTATDVFALGVILYELACGQHPFLAKPATPYAMQRAVLETEPRRLSAALGERTADTLERAHLRGTQPARLRRALHGDLNRIVRKALAKDPAARYGSAAALGDDLQRWLRDEPVQAAPASFRYRARKFLLRHRWPVAASVLVAAVLLAATAFSLQQARTARIAQRAAEANAQSAQATQRFLKQVFLAAEPWQHEGAIPDALQLADRAFQTLDRDLADQPTARADLYASLARLYTTAGANARSVQAGERAVALYESAVDDPERLFLGYLHLADAYSYQGDPLKQLSWIERAESLPGLAPRQRFLVLNSHAQAQRDRGRYDLALGRFREAYALGEELLQSTETPFARGNAERMLRRHRDAAFHLLQQDRARDGSSNRGWRLQMAIYRIGLLPPAQRRAQDLQLAADLEAERAAVWDDGTWQVVHAGLRAQLHLQHGDLDGALRIARALPLPAQLPDAETGGYDAEFWLGLSYVLLQGGDREHAERQFAQIESALRRYSDPLDPRPLLARVGAVCARGEPLAPDLAAALAQPPQPDYLGYAWLRDAPCPELRDSAGARHPPPQDHDHGEALRAALDAAAARLGKCRDGHRVAIGGSCAASELPSG